MEWVKAGKATLFIKILFWGRQEYIEYFEN